MTISHRVAITGIGVIDTLGSSVRECFSALCSNSVVQPTNYSEIFDTSVKEVADAKVFPVYQTDLNLPSLDRNIINSLGRSQKYILHCVENALTDSNVSRKTKNVAVVISNVTSGHDNYLDRFSRVISGKRIKPSIILQDGPDFASSLVAETYKFTGPTVCPSSACITGLVCLEYASRLVDDYDYVICATGDCVLNEPDLYSFMHLGAMGSTSSPFDFNRNGFVPGDGAACLILESEQRATARNAKIYAYIEKVALANDAYHPTSPDPNGTGAKLVMKKVTSGIDLEELSFCCAHATSTPIGDVIEYNAIAEILGKVPTVSFKSKIGHTMATSSLLETIYTVLSLHHGVVVKNFNLKHCDFDSLNILVHDMSSTTKKYAIKNSFAFGGKCASVLLSKE